MKRKLLILILLFLAFPLARADASTSGSSAEHSDGSIGFVGEYKPNLPKDKENQENTKVNNRLSLPKTGEASVPLTSAGILTLMLALQLRKISKNHS